MWESKPPYLTPMSVGNPTITEAIILSFILFLLRVEEDKNIADISPYDKNEQIFNCIRL